MENIMKYRHLCFLLKKCLFWMRKQKIYTQDLGHSFSPYGPPSRQITYIFFFIGVSGSIVAVLALAVLNELAKGLNVYLRSPIKDQNGRVTVMKNRIYSEDIKWDFFFNFQGAFSVTQRPLTKIISHL